MTLDVSSWDWPQWTYVALIAVGLLLEAALHGEPRSGKHNFMVALVLYAFSLSVLGFGGFWSPAS